MALLFIPVAQVGVTAGMMLAIKSFVTIGHYEGAWQVPLSITMTSLGIGLFIVAGRAFFRAKILR